MKIKLNKKPLKNLNNAQAITPQATPPNWWWYKPFD